MRSNRRTASIRRETLLAGGVLLAAAILRGQAPSEERIPIRDPEKLAALGLPRNAKNVYVWAKADRSRGRPQDAAAVEGPESWGTASGYTTVMGYELLPLDVGRYWRSIGATFCQVNSSGREAAAQLDLPDGASLTQLKFWAYDTDPVNWLTFDVFESCQAPGSGESTTTLIASAETFGSIGTYYGSTPLNGYTVNNLDCHYSVRVTFAQPNQECVGDVLQVQKFQIAWVRQVSPSPAVATFNDVPTSHPFFQFIEALAKSGITAGCGAGNYCPNQPLTRGQMAVFLAKALGLAWP